ncbi:MAG: tRNA (adenosine(37)-N6)-dimethylallyltransferase MiaA [Epsilonproteobacteria bacterium]|nr:tRNA (adenosine(37)-N6)-dimethylallyltransferase MiaA [Campylobacterota bacterium]
MLNNRIIVITGPTGSGKTALSEKIAQRLNNIEVINADVGQFYKPLSVGTAKPDLAKQPFRSHLFDVLDEPEDLDVAAYRDRVKVLIRDIYGRGNVPVVVGGSLFYIKALFFEPHHHVGEVNGSVGPKNPCKLEVHESGNWDLLRDIDPCRAAKIHPNDVYRINRALELWRKTGRLPSEFVPQFNPLCDAFIVYLGCEKDYLRSRLKQRTDEMLSHGWLEEVEGIRGTKWEAFVRRKKLIGYVQLLDFIEGTLCENLDEVSKTIFEKTWQYAKRQRIFWDKFEDDLLEGLSGKGDHDTIISRLSISGDLWISAMVDDIEGYINKYDLQVRDNSELF